MARRRAWSGARPAHRRPKRSVHGRRRPLWRRCDDAIRELLVTGARQEIRDTEVFPIRGLLTVRENTEKK